MNLPQLAEDIPAGRPYAAVFARPWYGEAAIWRSATEDGFEFLDALGRPARIGALAFDLYGGPAGRFDLGNEAWIDLPSAALASVTDQALFAGENALAVESAAGVWEVLQFATAELMSPGRWRLRRLLRGQLGTEDAIGNPAPAGARVVMLDAAVTALSIADADIGLPWNWRIGPARVAAGDPINLAIEFTPEGRGLRPYSPAHLRGTPQPGGAILLSWIRRTRVGRRRQLGSGRGAARRGARGVRARNPRRRGRGAQRGGAAFLELHLHHRDDDRGFRRAGLHRALPRLPDRRARSRRAGRGVVVIPLSQTQETIR